MKNSRSLSRREARLLPLFAITGVSLGALGAATPLLTLAGLTGIAGVAVALASNLGRKP